MSTYIIFGGNGQIASGFIKKYIKKCDLCIIVDKNISLETESILSKREINYKFIESDVNTSNSENIKYFLKEKNLIVDYIIFAVGINPMNDFFTSTVDSFEQTINTNFISVFKNLKLIFEYLAFNCSIVVIASQNGIVGHENRICYGSSKAALIHLVKNLSIDFANCGYTDIKINSISPGYVLSDRNKDFFESNKGRKLINKSPYKKIPTIENVVDCIEFLLNEKSTAIRGQNLIVDYGYTII